MAELGTERAVVRRSLRGLLIGVAVLVVILGGLAIWNLAFRGRIHGYVGAFIAAVVALPAAWVYLKSPRRIFIHDEGVRVAPYIGAPRSIRFEEIADARISIAPLGKRPRVVFLRTKDQGTLTASDAEYHDLDALIDALLTHAQDRVDDQRPA